MCMCVCVAHAWPFAYRYSFSEPSALIPSDSRSSIAGSCSSKAVGGVCSPKAGSKVGSNGLPVDAYVAQHRSDDLDLGRRDPSRDLTHLMPTIFGVLRFEARV